MPSNLSSTSSDTALRFVALDISKSSVMVAAVDATQLIVLVPKKISTDKFPTWANQNLHPSDKVVLEATGDAWQYFDLLQPLVAEVSVANPSKVKLIAQTKVKTDTRDALALARLLAADLVPSVWVPPLEVRELRSLVSHRHRLVGQRTQIRNRLHAILASQHILPPAGDPFAHAGQQWWQQLKVSPTNQLLIKQNLALLVSLQTQIAEAEQALIALSSTERWSSQSIYLIQLPGISVITAMVILSAIGDISRFANAKQLVGYSGLGASIYASGQVVRQGAITKQGRRELRTALVEAAWIATAQPGWWKEEYERLVVRLGANRAIIAIARKLLVVIWHVLSKQVADKHVNETKVAQKLLSWGYKLRTKGRSGLGCPAFVRQELTKLKLGQREIVVKWSGRSIPIAGTNFGAK